MQNGRTYANVSIRTKNPNVTVLCSLVLYTVKNVKGPLKELQKKWSLKVGELHRNVQTGGSERAVS